MLTKIKSIRPLDAAIAAAAVALLLVSLYLGYSVWAQKKASRTSAPISRAISELEGMIKKSPKNVDLRLQLAQTYTIAGMDDDAINQYQQVLELQKTNVAALSGLGFITAREQDWKRSEEYWRKTIDVMNKHATNKQTKQYETANFYMGNVLLEQKKYEDAVGYFKEALRVNRTASDTHFLLAQAYRGLGADDQYKAELEYALAFEPKLAQANYEYGQILLAEKDLAGAAQYLRIAVDAAPNRKEPKDALAKLGTFAERIAAAKKLESSDPTKALVEARIAVAIDPADLDGLMLLAAVYEKTGDKQAAVDTYPSIIDQRPASTEAKAALERIKNDK